MVQQISTNTFGVSKWVVSPDATQGTHTTITSALTAASSGDTILIRDGTYTENLTLKAGVNLAAFIGDELTPNVTIVGKCTMTTAGTVTISGIRLQTNSDFFLAVTGSAASVVNLVNCYLNVTNNTGISYTSSSSSSQIACSDCKGDIATTGITMIVATGAGTASFTNCFVGNGGASTTPSSTSACQIAFFNGLIAFPCSTSGTGAFTSDHCSFNTGNATCITTSGTGGSVLQFTELQSGTASALSIGAGTTISAFGCNVNSSNTNAITGAGTLNFSDIAFFDSSKINTTTQTLKISTAFQKAVKQVFTSSGTYTPTTGMKYCDIVCVGGGGGGGGTANTGASTYAAGAGGGGGGTSYKLSSAATIGASQTVTIGAAGTAGTSGNNAGGNGGDTSVGSICIGKGGSGGAGNTGSGSSTGGAGGIAGTGDSSTPGQPGGNTVSSPASVIQAYGWGGASSMGFGGNAVTGGSPTTGNAGQNYGGGGSGGGSFNAAGAAAGGAGAAGLVIITEYV